MKVCTLHLLILKGHFRLIRIHLDIQYIPYRKEAPRQVSTFRTVTAMAAIDNVDDIDDFQL